MSNSTLVENSANMSGRKFFELLSPIASEGAVGRLGRLSLPGKNLIETPNFVAVTSRGALPHLTPDNLRKHITVGGLYMGLEDFIEKKDIPIFQTPDGNGRRLHKFSALPSNVITILAPRRFPAVTTPFGNTAKAMAVFTSTGFRNLTVSEYASAVETLRPDIVLPMADLPHTSTTPASKKLIKMTERSELWLDEFLRNFPSPEVTEDLESHVFAPVLPVEYPIQWDYLRHISEDILDQLAGLAVYDVSLLPDLTNYSPLTLLPKLSLDAPNTPHEVLRQVSLGIDICTIPFVNTTSDSGVAMTFSFPPPAHEGLQPLGINMWSFEHSRALMPLAESCQCYTCSKHHRAYLQHLLNAKEMLGWNLLQIHNHHVISEFFKGIRESLSKGVAEFDGNVKKFFAAYEASLPEGTGARPRARGYHFKSEAGQDRINKPAWTDLETSPAQPSPAGDETPSNESQGAILVPNIDTEAVAATLEITHLSDAKNA